MTLQASIQNADAHSAIVDQYGLHEILDIDSSNENEHDSSHCCHCYNSSTLFVNFPQEGILPIGKKSSFSTISNHYQTYLSRLFRPPIQ